MTDENTKTHSLTDAEIDQIAERAAHKAFETMTTRVFIFVGKGLLERLFWIIGIITLSMYFWLKSKGVIE